MISTVAGKLDSILIFQFMGGALLALFAFATAIPDHLRASLKNLSALAVPKLAHKEKAELKKIVYNKTMLIAAGTVGLALVYIFSAPLLFSLFFPQYMEAVIYSQVYAITILLSITLGSAYFDAQIAIKERYVMNFIASTTTITSTILGVFFFGLWGAICARIVSRLIIVTAESILIKYH